MRESASPSLDSTAAQVAWRYGPLLLFLAIATAIAIGYYPVGPSPSDDLLYLDAAHLIAKGEYTPPSPARPFHHYVRWPLVLPLSGFVAALGANRGAAVFNLAILSICGVLSFALAGRLTSNGWLARIAAFAPLALPTGLAGFHLLRVEPVAIACFLTAALFLQQQPGHPIAAGVAAAFGIYAQPMNLLSIPCLFGFLKHGSREGQARRFVRFCVGGIIVAVLTMLLETLVFRDPFLQITAMKMWHFQLEQSSFHLREVLNPNNPERFLFAFTLALWHQHPYFLILLSAGALIGCASGRWRAYFIGILSSFALFEVLGAFVAKKIYLRFLAVPAYLVVVLTICLSTWVIYAWRRSAIQWIRSVGAAASGSIMLVVLLAAVTETRVALFQDPWIAYFKDVVASIVCAQRMSEKPLEIGIERYTIPGLVSWPFAIRAYSDYSIPESSIRIVNNTPASQEPDIVIAESDAFATRLKQMGWSPLASCHSRSLSPVVLVNPSR